MTVIPEQIINSLFVDGVLDRENVELISQFYREQGGPLVDILTALNLMGEGDYYSYLYKKFSLPYLAEEELFSLQVDRELLSLLPYDSALAYLLLPIRREGDFCEVCAVEPLPEIISSEICKIFGVTALSYHLTRRALLVRAIRFFYQRGEDGLGADTQPRDTELSPPLTEGDFVGTGNSIPSRTPLPPKGSGPIDISNRQVGTRSTVIEFAETPPALETVTVGEGELGELAGRSETGEVGNTTYPSGIGEGIGGLPTPSSQELLSSSADGGRGEVEEKKTLSAPALETVKRQIFCYNCGAPNLKENVVCSNCGVKLKAQLDPQEGQQLKDWMLVKLLGEGGMGVVYEAVNVKDGRKAAIKILQTKIKVDSQVVERFHREFEIMRRLNHPNITKFYDFDFLEEFGFFLVMELLEGCDLSEYLDTHPEDLSLDTVYRIIAPVCNAMEYAHSKGIIHRDLKPDNFFLVGYRDNIEDFETVKILDFGIAKIKSEEKTKLTQTGTTVGTPHYISPEQAMGQPVDARSDIYSLSVILFELLTRKHLFFADNPLQCLLHHVSTTPPKLSEARPDRKFPKALEDLVFQGLAKDPSRRPRSMAEFKKLLHQAIYGNPNTTIFEPSIEEKLADTKGVYVYENPEGKTKVDGGLFEGEREKSQRKFLLSPEDWEDKPPLKREPTRSSSTLKKATARSSSTREEESLESSSSKKKRGILKDYIEKELKNLEKEERLEGGRRESVKIPPKKSDPPEISSLKKSLKYSKRQDRKKQIIIHSPKIQQSSPWKSLFFLFFILSLFAGGGFLFYRYYGSPAAPSIQQIERAQQLWKDFRREMLLTRVSLRKRRSKLRKVRKTGKLSKKRVKRRKIRYKRKRLKKTGKLRNRKKNSNKKLRKSTEKVGKNTERK